MKLIHFFLTIIIPRLNLAQLTDDELDGFAQDVIEALTGNANFTTTTPTLTNMKLLLEDYRDKLALAKNGTPADTQAKKDARKVLMENLTLLADNISLQSNGNLAKFLTSGFSAKRVATPAGTLPPPDNFKLNFGGNDGELKASCKKVLNNHGYEYYLGTDPTKPDEWPNKKTSSSTKYTFTGLVSGTKYYGRCRAVGARGKMGEWSDISSKTCP